MKRIFVFTLLLSFLLPGLKAQSDQNVVAGFTIETTTIDVQEVPAPTPKPVKKFKARYQQNVLMSYTTEFDDCNKFAIDYIGGCRFNRYFYAGVGLGLSFEDGGSEDGGNHFYMPCGSNVDMRPTFTTPLYLHARLYLGNKRHQPFFIAVSAGANIAYTSAELESYEYYYYGSYYNYYNDDYNTTNAFFEPSFGVDFRINSRVSMNLQLGVNIHGVTNCYADYGGLFEYDKKTECDMSIRLGCTF